MREPQVSKPDCVTDAVLGRASMTSVHDIIGERDTLVDLPPGPTGPVDWRWIALAITTCLVIAPWPLIQWPALLGAALLMWSLGRDFS